MIPEVCGAVQCTAWCIPCLRPQVTLDACTACNRLLLDLEENRGRMLTCRGTVSSSCQTAPGGRHHLQHVVMEKHSLSRKLAAVLQTSMLSLIGTGFIHRQ